VNSWLADVRGIVFDLDGTLVDSYGAITESLNVALSSAGLDPVPEEKVRRMVGLGLETLMSRAMGEARVEEGVRVFRRHYETICVERTTLLPQVAETLECLRGRGYLMAVATNKPSYFARRILEGLGADRHFTAVLGPDRVENKKPHPEMVRNAILEMGLSASRTLYVGDMEVDIQTARAAGVRVVVLPTGSRSLEELRRSDPDLLIVSFGDLLDLLPGQDEGPPAADPA
jgi:2-phosphoglycolate phosphatase